MADPVPPGDQEALARRVSDLTAKFDALNSANNSVKWTTRFVLAGITISSIVGVTLLISPLYGMTQDPEPYKIAIREEAEERLRPALVREVNEIMQKAGPQLWTVAQEEYKNNEERFLGAVDKERQLLVADLTEWGTAEYESRRTRIEKGLIERIQRDIPELKNQEQAELIMGNAQKAMDASVNRILDKHLNDHIQHVNNIGNNLQTFPVPPEIQAMDDFQLREELTSALGGYALMALRGSLNSDTKALLRQVSSEPPADAVPVEAAPSEAAPSQAAPAATQ